MDMFLITHYVTTFPERSGKNTVIFTVRNRLQFYFKLSVAVTIFFHFIVLTSQYVSLTLAYHVTYCCLRDDKAVHIRQTRPVFFF